MTCKHCKSPQILSKAQSTSKTCELSVSTCFYQLGKIIYQYLRLIEFDYDVDNIFLLNDQHSNCIILHKVTQVFIPTSSGFALSSFVLYSWVWLRNEHPPTYLLTLFQAGPTLVHWGNPVQCSRMPFYSGLASYPSMTGDTIMAILKCWKHKLTKKIENKMQSKIWQKVTMKTTAKREPGKLKTVTGKWELYVEVDQFETHDGHSGLQGSSTVNVITHKPI